MRHLKSSLRFLSVAAAIFSLVALVASCSSRRKVEKTPIETFIQPCTDYRSSEGAIHAWAMGKSDSETTARKKAQATATADLAAQVKKTVKSTIDEYGAILTEGGQGASKVLLVEKTRTTVDQTLRGATIVCDRWAKDEATGQHINYIVMEVKAESFIQALEESLKPTGQKVDADLLKKIFIKHIKQ